MPRLAGASVIAFELAFLGLALTVRGRPIAIVLGLAFHALVARFLYIPFSSLWLMYVILLDGARMRSALARLFATPVHRSRAPSRGWGIAAVGTFLVLAVAQAGWRGRMQAWPFACYPTFEYVAPAIIEDMAVEIASPDGALVTTLREPADRPQPASGTVWRLRGLYGDPIEPARLRAYAADLAARRAACAALTQPVVLRFVAESYAIAPERYGEPPVRRSVILGAPAEPVRCASR